MSLVSRWKNLGQLTVDIASQEVVGRVRKRWNAQAGSTHDTRVVQARAMAQRMGRLKGAAMKVGQQVAVLASQMDLPDEVQEALGTLHADAEPVPFSTIERTLQDEFQIPLSSLFSSIDRVPLGTASLAQAHAATLVDGRSVVVKVQHEGVRESVDHDLLAVRGMLLAGRAFGRDRRELDDIFDELRTRLHEELDLLQEAVNLQHFSEMYGEDPRFCIPRHVPSLCTERVLTLDRVYGQTLDVFAVSASDEARHRAGLAMGDLFLESAFVHRVLHADPHPGNYLFTEDGTLGLLDFGCVKRFNPFFIGSYARMVRATLDRDNSAILSAAIEMGAWDGEGDEAGQVILDFCDAIMDPIRDNALHRIGGAHDTVTERVRPIVERMFRHPQIRGPRDIIFLHRTLGGMYALARQVRVEDRWEQRIRPVLEHAIDVAEGRRS